MSSFGLWRNRKLLNHSLVWSQFQNQGSLLQLFGYMVEVSVNTLVCTLKARQDTNVHAIVPTFPELVLCFGTSCMLFCMMGFTNFLLLKGAVLLLAVCYYNFSFAGSVLVWLFGKSTLLGKLTKPILLLGWLFVGLLSWVRLMKG